MTEHIHSKSSAGQIINRGRWVVTAIIIVAMLLRLILGLLNREANDNHVEVVNQIIANHELPESSDCWSCYQPKMYYIICAVIIKALNINEFYARIRAMQLINVFISFFILLVFWKFINGQNMKAKSKHLVFAFFAFNPCLTGINVQSTNDTLVIFFGVLAVYACGNFFRELKIGAALLLITALLGGMLTKASGVIITCITGFVFMIKILTERVREIRIKTIKYLLILFVVTITIVPFAGGYYHNYEKYGNLTLSCWEKDPPPFFFKKTFITRQGLRSVFDGFFTFRFIGMIRHPYINNEWNNFPEHRTSLWSQIYGRTVFMHFDQWPPSWQSQGPLIVNIGRLLIILGIVPLILFCAGILKNTRQLIRKLLKMDRDYLAFPNNHFYLFTTIAFLASSIFYTYTYRDFSSMKSIYIFPGFLAFIKMFVDGLMLIKSKRIASAVNLVLTLMIIFSIADIVFLIYQLYDA